MKKFVVLEGPSHNKFYTPNHGEEVHTYDDPYWGKGEYKIIGYCNTHNEAQIIIFGKPEPENKCQVFFKSAVE